MAQHSTSYASIDRPYDNLLQRGVNDVSRTSNVGPNSSAAGNSQTAGSGSTSVGSQVSQQATTGGTASAPTGVSYTPGSTSPSGSNGSVEVMSVKSDGALNNVWIDNFIRSKNWKPKRVGFNIDGETGKAEFTNVYISGEIQALSGLIGGFTIGDTDLSVVDENNTVTISSGATSISIGPTNQPTFTVTSDGQLTATRANITGSITAQSGTIGGFSILNDHLTAGYGTTRIRLDTAQGIFLGDNDFDLAPFSVSLAGELKSVSGQIGGWDINENSLSSSTIFLDSELQRIKVGLSSPLIIDGISKKIESSNYVSGINGSGFHLDENLLEVGNISARGMIRTAVFQKNVVSTVGGSLAVLDGDVLEETMTQLDNSTMTTKGATTFSLGDILRIKDGVDDEWFIVTDITSAPTYTVTRDTGGLYSSNNNPAWKKGATIVNYRGNGSGGVYMTASDTNAPYISIFDHAGTPWSTVTTRARLGNLNGYLGYTSDIYGIGIGDSTNNMKYDPINGLNIQGNLTIGTTNSIKGGQTDFAIGTGFFLGYSGDYKFSIGNSTNYVRWDGLYLKIKGSFDVGAEGVINNSYYTVANLPQQPTSVGFNNPAGL